MRRVLVLLLLIAAYFGAWEATKREAEAREMRWENEQLERMRESEGPVVTFALSSDGNPYSGLWFPPRWESKAPFLIAYHDGMGATTLSFWFFGLFED